MDLDALQHRGRGRHPDYVFGTAEHGFTGFDVARFHAIEEISRPFEIDITLIREADRGPVSLDHLLDAPATLHVASEARFRPIHGIVAEAEEVERTAKLSVYRVLLVPHLFRARYRRRCRNFIGQTVEQIVSAVLENRAPAFPQGTAALSPLSGQVAPPAVTPDFSTFKPPRGLYRWAVSDPARIQDPTVRPYVVQYNESDLDFVSRLLEDEGISYFFEHGEDACVLTLTDAPGKAPLFARDQTFRLHTKGHGGNARDQEVIRAFRDARRMRSRSVTARDFSFKRSRTVLEARVSTADGAADTSGHFEFPARDEEVDRDPCMAPARFRMQRFAAERNFCSGAGTVRTMEPGFRFTMHDDSALREDADYLVVRVETFAAERHPKGTALDREPFGFPGSEKDHVGYENEFVVLPVQIAYRPALVTERPRIDGVQSAIVTAEETPDPKAEINCDRLGRVRVRFPWDQRDPDQKQPSSDWIRVSQVWAGAAYGAVHTPRVGHEVLIAYQQGDPDRPLVVGRVYNEQAPPPYDLAKDPTVSTVKSQSSPGGAGFNEFRFEDRAKKEQIYLHAQRNFDEVVNANHTTMVGGDEKNVIRGHQSDEVDKDRKRVVKGKEDIVVEGDRTTYFRSDETHVVGGARTTTIGIGGGAPGVRETLAVKGDRKTTVEQDDDLHIKGDERVEVNGSHGSTYGGDYVSGVIGDRRIQAQNIAYRVASQISSTCDEALFDCGFFQITSTGGVRIVAAGHVLTMDLVTGISLAHSSGPRVELGPGRITLDNDAGASLSLLGDKILLNGTDMTTSLMGDKQEVVMGTSESHATGQMKMTSVLGISGSALKITWNA
jgi:type VI secretion system secreted protein VgrG